MTKYFVTIWLKQENQKQWDERLREIKQIITKSGIQLEREIKIVSSSSRATVYGTASTEKVAKTDMERFIANLKSDAGLTAKGRFLKE